MDTDIRKYILNNLKDCTEDDIKETILASIESKDEVFLPGLGVLFELTLNKSDENNKKEIINTLFKTIKKA